MKVYKKIILSTDDSYEYFVKVDSKIKNKDLIKKISIDNDFFNDNENILFDNDNDSYYNKDRNEVTYYEVFEIEIIDFKDLTIKE